MHACIIIFSMHDNAGFGDKYKSFKGESEREGYSILNKMTGSKSFVVSNVRPRREMLIVFFLYFIII